MELEEAHKNLRALRLLYRLLEDDSLGLRNVQSEDLIERARGLLKNMLDVTAERVFETILKINGISKRSCTSQREKHMSSLQLKPPMASNSSQCSLEYPTTCSEITLRIDEQPQLKLPANEADPRLPKSSSISDKGKNKRRLGNVGKEINETSLQNRICEIQNNPSASSWVEPKEEEDEGDVSNNDLVNAIKRIESRILALQLCSNLAFSKRNSTGDQIMHKVKDSDGPVVQINEGIESYKFQSNDHLMNQTSECIRGFRVPLNQDDFTRKPSMLAGQITEEKTVNRNLVAQPDANKREKKQSPQNHHKKMTLLPENHESEEFISSSGSSASWTPQQSDDFSGSDDDSEEYLPFDDNSEDERSNSYSHNDDDDAGPSHRVGNLKFDRSYHKKDPEKPIGRLRKLKNKLGLIFHHHHHHHHHHQYHHDDEDFVKGNHRHSMWNGLQKILHGKNYNKHKVIKKGGKVEKTIGVGGGGGVVARVPRGNQVGQFHGLVEGVLRHIRHSKKGKPRGNRKKKLHWWQILKRHKGVKLKKNNRGRFKVGFQRQKS